MHLDLIMKCAGFFILLFAQLVNCRRYIWNYSVEFDEFFSYQISLLWCCLLMYGSSHVL